MTIFFAISITSINIFAVILHAAGVDAENKIASQLAQPATSTTAPADQPPRARSPWAAAPTAGPLSAHREPHACSPWAAHREPRARSPWAAHREPRVRSPWAAVLTASSSTTPAASCRRGHLGLRYDAKVTVVR
jgi:hypothetical protein